MSLPARAPAGFSRNQVRNCPHRIGKLTLEIVQYFPITKVLTELILLQQESP